MNTLERAVSDTATRAEVDAALTHKASIADVNHTLAEISITIERSASSVGSIFSGLA